MNICQVFCGDPFARKSSLSPSLTPSPGELAWDFHVPCSDRPQIKSGQLARIASEGRRIQAKNGHLASMRCKHWRIDQGKPCICGKHLTVLRKTAVV